MLEIVPNWHPIFVHFTVALLSLSVVLYVVTLFIKSSLKEQWRIVSRWALWFGAGFTIITGLTGLYAYNTVAHDAASHLAMTDHRNWAVVTIILFLSLATWSITSVRMNKTPGSVFAVCMVIAGSVLASTAWRGGEVVYRYGLGVMSLPQAEGDGHNHSHDEGHELSSISSQRAGSEHGGDNHQEKRVLHSVSVGTMINDDGHDHVH